MEITFFGLVWIALLMLFFIVSDNRYMISMVLFAMVLQCNNVLTIGATTIGVQPFTVAVALLKLLLTRREKSPKRLVRVGGQILAILTFIGFILLNIFLTGSSFGEVWINVAMLTVYSLFAIVLYVKRLSLQIDEKWVEKNIDAIAIFIFVVGVLQMAAVAGVPLLRPILTTLIFNDTSAGTDIIFHSKNHFAFYSSFMEPSYCGAFLVGLFMMLASRTEFTKKNSALVVLTAISIALTFSTTAYVGFLVCLLVLLLPKYYRKSKLVKNFVPIMILGVALFAILNLNVLDQVIFSKSETGSFSVRNTLNRWAMERFVTSPIIGIGIGQSRASSLLLSLLSEIGIIGFILYAVIIARSYMLMNMKKYPPSVVSASFFVVAIAICQWIACPDLNFSPFWMAMFLQAMLVNVENRRKAAEELEAGV